MLKPQHHNDFEVALLTTKTMRTEERTRLVLAFQAWHHIANVEGPTPKKRGLIETKSLGFRFAVGVFSFQNLTLQNRKVDET